MPVIRFPANYPLPQSQVPLLADPNALPGFNPTDDAGPADGVSAGDPTPIPASPTTASDAQDANTVALPPLNGNGNGSKAKIPPGRSASIPPPPEAEPPPASAPGAAAPTPSPAAGVTTPESALPGAPPPDMAAGLEPSKDGEPKTTAEKLAALQPPDRPSSNWAQRLGLAVLSLTKYRDQANMLVHPKWTEQMQGYLGQRQALEAQQQEEIAQGQAEAGEAQKEAVAEWRKAQAEPHRGQQEIDPNYAKENMPWLRPDASGQFWVDKTLANTLSKPDAAAKLHVVGNALVDETGKVLYQAPEKPEKPAGTFEKDFLPGWAQQHGKTIDQLQGTERQQALQDFNASQADKDPEMRAARLASMQTAEILKQMQLQQQPTPEQAAQVATDVIHHRLAPEQMSQMFGGFGPTGQAFKRMVYGEAKKIDPNFDFEQSAADYNFSKSPAFQNTVRMMDSALNSTDRLQQSANALANGKVRSINALVNAGRDQFNSVNLRKFQTDRTLVGDEVAKVLQGGGTGSGTSDAKLKQAQDIFRDSDDPTVIASAINEVKQIMGYRRQAVTRGTYMEGTTPPERKGTTENNPPAAPPTVPAGAQVKYSPSTKQHYFSTDKGKTWQLAPAQ